MKYTTIAILLSGISLVACGGDPDSTSGSDSAEIAGTETLADGAVFHTAGVDFDEQRTRHEMTVSNGSSVSISGAFENLETVDVGDALTYAIPAEIEAAVAGTPVTVSIKARGGSFGATYYTMQVGNSGKRDFGPSGDWEVFEFTYDVPPMRDSQGDLIAIAPTSAEAVEIAEVAVKPAE